MMSEVGQLRTISGPYSAGSLSNRVTLIGGRGRSSVRALATICALLSACSSNLILSSGPQPRVEDCMLLQQATPTRYVCDGKIYTAVELADIRKGANSGVH